MPGASWGPTEAPPSYENALTPLEFEQKTASVVEQSLQEAQQRESGPSNGKQRASEHDEFEDWDDKMFEAAAAAYRARQARQQKTTSSSGGGFTSTSMFFTASS